MINWSEEQRQIRAMFRKFVESEVAPHREELEFGDMPPYAILRKMIATFGIGEMAKGQFFARLERERSGDTGGDANADADGGGQMAAMRLLPIIELSRYSPGLITAMGVSMGLTANAIIRHGTIEQQEKYVPDLLTMEKIGAWAITEPGSGSDAFGSMMATAKRDGEGGYILNGNKTFITNGPYADTIVFICKLDEGNPRDERKVLSFVLDGDTPGLTRSKPLRKMGLHASPTGELFLEDVRVAKDRLLGETEDVPARSSAKRTFTAERTAVAAMALGIIERCLELCTAYANDRVQFGRPIGEFQLVQLKLAKMEVARMNVQNLVFRQIEMAQARVTMDIAEASACKLYSAQAAMEVALEAVQLFGGNGYMAEFQVEQLCRDAKVLQIYGGTDEIQVSQIARTLLAR
jgi:alkylation response protein AidB-like acyl-CoA dehydrogenase